MKKSFIMSLIGISLIACSNEEFISPADNGEETVSTNELRTKTEAVAIATDALNEFYPAISRSARDMSSMNVVMLGNFSTRSGEVTNPLYVVNFGDNNGYAIISANKGVEPLLAVTESGSITSLDEIDNPGLGLFVAGAMKLEKDTTAIVPGPGTGGGELVDIWRNDTVFHVNTKVDPRITVNWGQDYPEGSLCSNYKSGCVATAGAQALSFFEYPENLTLTFPERTSNGIALNWNNLKLIKSTIYQLPLKDSDKPLATLCREIGHSINSTYYGDQSPSAYLTSTTSATLNDLCQYFKRILPNNRFTVSNISISNPETNNVLGNGIIIIGGSGTSLNEITGGYESLDHAWIIDGYILKKYTVYVYYHKSDSPIEYLERQFDKTELYSHINWGMRGIHNGYFNNNAFIVYFNDNPSNDIKYNLYENFHYFTIQTK